MMETMKARLLFIFLLIGSTLIAQTINPSQVRPGTFQTGTYNFTNVNGPIGGTTPAAGYFTTVTANATVSAYGVTLGTTGMGQGHISTPIVYDLFQDADGTAINGTTAQSGNAAWVVTGVAIANCVTQGTYLISSYAGALGCYAFLPNTSSVGGTPQPITTFGETAVFCNDPSNSPATAVLAAANTSGSLSSVLHAIWSPFSFGLSHLYSGSFYSFSGPNNGVLNLLNDCASEYAMQMDIAYPTEYANTATWTSGATSITVSSATGIVAGQPVMDGVVGIPWGTVVAATYTPGSTTVPLTQATTTTQSTATTVVFGGANVTVHVPGVTAFTVTDPFIGTLASWQMIPTAMFEEPSGVTSGPVQVKYGSAWMGGPMQASKLTATGQGALTTDVMALKGTFGTLRQPYAVAIGGGTGWYRIATSAILDSNTLSADFSITALGAVAQLLKFTASSLTGGTPYILQTSNQFNSAVIDQVRISNDGSSNIALDVHVLGSTAVTLNILGVGVFTPNLNPSVGATAYTNVQAITVAASVNTVTPSLIGGVGWYTIATQNSGWGGYRLSGYFNITANGIAATTGQQFAFWVDGYNDTCPIAQMGSTAINYTIDQLRCSWNGSSYQLDAHLSNAASVTLTISASGNFALNNSPAVGATVLSGGNTTQTITAGGASIPSVLANGTTATTQTTGDNSTKVATDAFVLANAGSPSKVVSASVGGTALIAGQCAYGSVTISGLSSTSWLSASPQAYPGDGFWWEVYRNVGDGGIYVKVCAAVAGTPAASAYNVVYVP